MKDFKGIKVGVLGLGVEGFSSANCLHRKGALVTVLDRKEENELPIDQIKKLKDKSIKVVAGKDYLKDVDKFDIVVRTPGIKLSTPEIVDAKEKGVEVSSHIKIFFDLCPAKIIGITGTKGKGTTASLIYEMLKKAGKDVYLGGNIGTPPLEFLDKLTSDSWVVLELSSFQLQDLTKSPHIAVMLMITSEHLDYHKDTNEYVDAKRNLVRFQNSNDFAVLNRDYIASHESDIHTDAKIFQISRERDALESGCYVKKDKIYVKQNGEEREIISTEKILLPGKHNFENVCAAVMAATIAGVSKDDIKKVLKSFKGLEHRLELVGEVNGVKYYDDSFSTTPETAIAAIEAFENPEILILGGSSKGSDFKDLGRIIRTAKNIKAIIGIGDEWERIKEEFVGLESDFLLIEGATDMKTIVLGASKIARPGDVVLLSPACASFGMFKNYKDRGEQFRKEVESLSPNE